MPSPSKRTINCNVISSAGLVAWASDARQTNNILAECGAHFCIEACNGRETDHSDQADQHTIFDQGRALLIGAEAGDQSAHLNLPSKILYCAQRMKSAQSNASTSRPTSPANC